MATTKEDIRRWLEEGKKLGATHLIVVCDTYDWEDYPFYVMPQDNVREKERELSKSNRIMEVYSYNYDLETQLSEYRAFHYN